jgi:hypothetical protein
MANFECVGKHSDIWAPTMKTLMVTALFVSILGGPGHPSRQLILASMEQPPVIGLQVAVDGKSRSRLRTPAGQQATIGIPGKGTVGLTPLVRGSVLELVVVEAPEDIEGGNARELARLELRLGEVVAVESSIMHAEIEWSELLPREAREETAEPQGPCTVCCVYCDNKWQCACDVQTPCGQCCCATACACTQGLHGPDSGPVVAVQTCSAVRPASELVR